MRAGYARVVWGRLDEVQPTDVVNPLDVSRFFFEGRSEARLPVALIRGRGSLLGTRHQSKPSTCRTSAAAASISSTSRRRRSTPRSPGEGLGVCLAIGCPTLPPEVVDDKPSAGAASAQGGARVSATTGRVDWSVSAYRGSRTVRDSSSRWRASRGRRVRIEGGSYPRFTMIGGDVETVRGEWGIRGEVAAFVDDNFQSPALTIAEGSSVEAGAGVDRKAGSYRFSGTVLFHRERRSGPAAELEEPRRSDLSFAGLHGAQVCPRALRAARLRRGEHNGRLRLRARDRSGSSATTCDSRHPRLVRRRGP